jgi:hypothetical protein
VILAGDSTYTLGPTVLPSDEDLDEDLASDEDLDDDPASDLVIVDPATLTFKPDGSATLPGGATSVTLTVSSADDSDLNHDIVINAATSGIEIVP